MENSEITLSEKQLISSLRNKLIEILPKNDENSIRLIDNLIDKSLYEEKISRDIFGHLSILFGLQTAIIAIEEESLRNDGVLAILLYFSMLYNNYTTDEIKELYGEPVSRIINGLVRIQELYKKSPIIESENFRNLLLSFAEDMRVILIMIADRLNLMRQIRDTKNLDAKLRVSEESSYLYAPLAHKLGLYKLKSELEDLSLKYLEHDAYYMIKDKLNATKRSRDAYINQFIRPVEERLKEAGLNFHIKGRTKSIHSIWQKMKKQKCGFEGIYDLFAIRIIIDAPFDKEKMSCWQAYSIITDMYQPNPKRLRDWLSVPKSNGYESLHITVLGPEDKWIEVQIRTERMDEIAERGLAAHWRYKGIKGESGIDEWLTNIRTALEAGDGLQAMDQFKMDLYEDEVFVFTPKGDLYKFPKGATVLDFAYRIHSRVGNQCVGAKINGKMVNFRETIKSGDQIEIITNITQKPKQEWLQIVKTSHAKSKIRLSLKEIKVKDGVYAKELLARRLKNRKIDIEENIISQVVKKFGFKETTEFYKQITDGRLEPNDIIEKYIQIKEENTKGARHTHHKSAENFSFDVQEQFKTNKQDDILTIDKNVNGVDYSLAKCCHPLYGDKIFGFVTVSGGIKIHRTDCPNAPEMRKRFGYRIIKAQWSGKGNNMYAIPLKITGHDDIGIVNNITSIIQKECNAILRSINIDSNDGVFWGNISVQVEDINMLDSLIKKMKTIKGIKSVERV